MKYTRNGKSYGMELTQLYRDTHTRGHTINQSDFLKMKAKPPKRSIFNKKRLKIISETTYCMAIVCSDGDMVSSLLTMWW